MYSFSWSFVGLGKWLYVNSSAFPSIRPLGLPSSASSISPPSMCGVSSNTFIARSAAVLATHMHPHTRVSTTG